MARGAGAALRGHRWRNCRAHLSASKSGIVLHCCPAQTLRAGAEPYTCRCHACKSRVRHILAISPPKEVYALKTLSIQGGRFGPAK